MEPPTKEGHLKKAGLCPGRLTHCGPGYTFRNNPVPLWPQLQLCLTLILPPAPSTKGPGRSPNHLCSPVSVQAMDHEVACKLAPAPLNCQSYLPRDPEGDMPIHTPEASSLMLVQLQILEQPHNLTLPLKAMVQSSPAHPDTCRRHVH